jgi:hypothetical protein
MADTIFKIPKLQGSNNYNIWSIRIESLLVREGYLEVITKNIALLEPKEHDLLQEKASKATAFIKLSLEDGPLL